MKSNEKFTFFIFGSTSELMQAIIAANKQWFLENVDRLILMQRTPKVPKIYEEFKPIVEQLDCSNPEKFRTKLDEIVRKYASAKKPMQVISTYGKFNWNYAKSNPIFNFTDSGFQINLIARLQIIDAFRKYAANTRFHVFGSLFANFPYTGDYATSMWYMNQLPKNSEYKDLDLIVLNLGGMKTRFWNYKAGPKPNPFLFPEIPTQKIFANLFIERNKGVITLYPTFIARFACFLGSIGVRVL